MVVRGWGQVLFGETHWTAAVAKDLMGDNGKKYNASLIE